MAKTLIRIWIFTVRIRPEVKFSHGVAHKQRYLLTCEPNEDSNQPAHPDQSLRCPHGETLYPLLSEMRQVKTLVKAHISKSIFSDIVALTLRKHAYSNILKI